MAQNVGALDISLEAKTSGLKETARLVAQIEKKVNDLGRTQDKTAQRAAASLFKQEQAFKKNIQAALNLRAAMVKQGAGEKAIGAVTRAINTQGRAVVRLGAQTAQVRAKLIKGSITEANARKQLNRITREADRINTQFNSKMGRQRRILNENSKATEKASSRKEKLKKVMRDLESAAVLGLGPLSGLGARIRSLGAIASRSAVLVAAFLGAIVGVTVVILKMGGAAISAAKDMERISGAMTAATGSAEGAAREFRFLADLSNRLGTDLRTGAVAFSQLAAAARGTALEGAGARRIFEGISAASVALRLSTDQTTGALRAITQMISKGTVQAEELRGQLGERLPGAFQLAAAAMGVTTKGLGEMLKKGEVLAEDLLPKLADLLIGNYGKMAEASDTLVQAQNRLNNAFFKMSLAFDTATGVSEVYKGLLKTLTKAVISLEKHMQSIVDVFTFLAILMGSVVIVAIVTLIAKWVLLRATMAGVIGIGAKMTKRFATTAAGATKLARGLSALRGFALKATIAFTGLLLVLRSPIFRTVAIAFALAATAMAAMKGAGMGLIDVNMEIVNSMRQQIKAAKTAGGVIEENRVIAREEAEERLDLINMEIKAIKILIKTRTDEIGLEGTRLSEDAGKFFGGIAGALPEGIVQRFFANAAAGLRGETISKMNVLVKVLQEEAALLGTELKNLAGLPELDTSGAEELSQAFKDLIIEASDAFTIIEAAGIAQKQLSIKAFDVAMAMGEATNASAEFSRESKNATEEAAKLVIEFNKQGFEGNRLNVVIANMKLKLDASKAAANKFRKQLVDIPKHLKSLRFEIAKLNSETDALIRGPEALDKFKLDQDILNKMEAFNKKLKKNGVLTAEAKDLMVAYEDALRSNAKAQEEFSTISRDMAKTLVDGLENAILAADGLGLSFKELGDALQKLILRAAVLDPLEKSISSFFGNVQGSFGSKLPNTFGEAASGIAGIFGSFFGGGGGSGGGGGGGGALSSLAGAPFDPTKLFKAAGGAFGANKPIIVGEQGPEILIPSTSGTIISNKDAEGFGGGTTIILNVNGVTDADSFNRAENQITAQLHAGLALASARNS